MHGWNSTAVNLRKGESDGQKHDCPRTRQVLGLRTTMRRTVQTRRRQPPQHPLATRGNVMPEYSTPHLTEIPHPSRALPRQLVTASATNSHLVAWLRYRQCHAVG